MSSVMLLAPDEILLVVQAEFSTDYTGSTLYKRYCE